MMSSLEDDKQRYILQIRDPILMDLLPGQSIIFCSWPVQDGLWYSMYEVSLVAHDTKLKLPVWKPSC